MHYINYGCDGASQYPHPSDADFMCKIRWIRMQMQICRAIKITSYYGYCDSTYLLKKTVANELAVNN